MRLSFFFKWYISVPEFSILNTCVCNGNLKSACTLRIIIIYLCKWVFLCAELAKPIFHYIFALCKSCVYNAHIIYIFLNKESNIFYGRQKNKNKNVYLNRILIACTFHCELNYIYSLTPYAHVFPVAFHDLLVFNLIRP